MTYLRSFKQEPAHDESCQAHQHFRINLDDEDTAHHRHFLVFGFGQTSLSFLAPPPKSTDWRTEDTDSTCTYALTYTAYYPHIRRLLYPTRDISVPRPEIHRSDVTPQRSSVGVT
jgi:hypothetical protein